MDVNEGDLQVVVSLSSWHISEKINFFVEGGNRTIVDAIVRVSGWQRV